MPFSSRCNAIMHKKSHYVSYEIAICQNLKNSLETARINLIAKCYFGGTALLVSVMLNKFSTCNVLEFMLFRKMEQEEANRIY